METAAALDAIARADAQLPDFNDPKIPIADETFVAAAEALGAPLHPRYEALLRTIGGGEDNAIWAPSTDGDLWAPHPMHGRGLVSAAREAWREGVPSDFLPISTNGCGDYYALRRSDGFWGQSVWVLDHELDWEARPVHDDILDWLVADAEMSG